MDTGHKKAQMHRVHNPVSACFVWLLNLAINITTKRKDRGGDGGGGERWAWEVGLGEKVFNVPVSKLSPLIIISNYLLL